MVITATPSYDSFTLLVTDLTWYRDSNKSIVWGYKLLTGTEWHKTSESVTGKPESMSHTFSNLMPGRTYKYTVEQHDDTMFVTETYQVTTLSEIGELTADEVTTSSIKAKFEDYVPATYTRVAKFRYGRTPSDREQKPTSYDCGQVVIPPNTADKDVSTLITGLKNSTSYNVYMTLYKVTYSGGAQRLVYMADYSVTATTGIPSSEEPSVSIEKITKRYDTSDLTIDLHTDYPGLYRFVVNICDDQDGVCWRTLILPPMENRLTVENCLVAFRQASFVRPGVYVYTQKSNIDIKAGIIVESDTEDIESLGYNYPVGNAKDMRLDHSDTIDGVIIYGETQPITIGFDETPILNYVVGDPCGVGANDIYTLANILYEKWDTYYKDFTEEDWQEWIYDDGSGEGYDTSLRRDIEDTEETIESMMAKMAQWADEILFGLAEAQAGLPVKASSGSLVKSIEKLSMEITRARGWSIDVNLDADPGEMTEATYFRKLSQYVKYVR